MSIQQSNRLQELLKTRIEAAHAYADGEDSYDASPGIDLLIGGFNLALKARDQNVYYAVVGGPDAEDEVAFFIIAPTEESAMAKVAAWEED